MHEELNITDSNADSASVIQYNDYREKVLQDYWLCCISREASLIGRKEVLTGKAKFGILGDGKEVPQVALAHVFAKGDWRSGYYRDQTIMFALGLGTIEDYFAQLYAHVENDPWSRGRQMNCHFASRTVRADGVWEDHMSGYNISADISPTGGQMARAVGLALASRIYRQTPELGQNSDFSDSGNEVCFCTIGDASTSEGIFWESVNAAAVLKIPLAISVWDDGYGISVPVELQTTKKSISRALEGFQLDEYGDGILLFTGKAWDYPGLCAMYERGIRMVRERHIPAVFHIQECTQPQGHSTSGSHERYKSSKRMQWELDADCIKMMGEWMTENGLATSEELTQTRERAKQFVRDAKSNAWSAYHGSVDSMQVQLAEILHNEANKNQGDAATNAFLSELNAFINPNRCDLVAFARRLRLALLQTGAQTPQILENLIASQMQQAGQDYHTHLYSENKGSALRVPVIAPSYHETSEVVNGYQILNAFFDNVFQQHPNVIAFGEDLGKIGDVNQGFAGLQEKYGSKRVFDTGIREWTIIGQAIGMSMRGLRPIAEIQYLDYLVYGLTALTDDLATLRHRTAGMQQAPAIIRTRGHRLEGIWHSGSQMGMVIHALRGIYVCVPRNMVQAAGMYRTLLHSNDPGLVVECLNGYRLKEKLPDNIGEYTVPLGLPEILRAGQDITVVSYGSTLRLAVEAAEKLAQWGIDVELIDVQTLLPFDLEGVISYSLQKTNRVLFVDEDVPGGASAYMMRETLEVQGAYRYLDSAPCTLTATAHRPLYGSDGDYFSKPSVEDIVEKVLAIMHEVNPARWPEI
ncbi:MAG TPA: thiamine pyrophosphate-dependent enzyme [Saprospiraceae bacterium]|nr:thiamine pyrophosphate-dependent enzyme [Saprospiraceae bacterium]